MTLGQYAAGNQEVDKLSTNLNLPSLAAYQSHWKRFKLGEVAQYINGCAFKPSDWGKEGLPIIRIQNLNDPSKPFNYFKGQLPDKYLVHRGDILISWSASLGAYMWQGEDAWVNQHIFKVVVNENAIDRNFFYWIMKKEIDRVAELSHGSTMQHVVQKDFLNVQISVPPLEEQKAIAFTLLTLDKSIQAHRKELELERERKAALMQHLFTHGTRNEPTKMSEVGEIPESWSIVKLGSVCLSSAFGPRFSATYYDAKGNIATLRTTDIDEDGNIDYSTMPLAKLDIGHFREHLLQTGDLVITRSGTCGIAAIFESFTKPVLPGAFLIRFRLSPQISPYFLQHYINSNQGKMRIAQLAGGAIQKNLTSTSLRVLDIPLPHLEEQNEIVKVCQACDSKIAALEKEITLQEELFRVLLDELMTGRLSTRGIIA